MKDELSGAAAQAVREAKAEQVMEATTIEHDDFLAGVEAADPNSFNVCISCD